MTPRRPDFPRTFTKGQCWRVNVGAHGSSVTVREKAKGGKVVLQWTEQAIPGWDSYLCGIFPNPNSDNELRIR